MASPARVEPLTPERRRELTREHLLGAAAQVFAEQGFHGASLDDVAAAAGFTKGAVYSNFRNKEDLFLAVLAWRYDQEMAALRETLESTEAPPSSERLADFVELVRRQSSGSGDDWGVLYAEFQLYALRNPVARAKLVELDRSEIAEVARVIEDERRRWDFHPVESAADTARIVVAFMRGVGMMRALDPALEDDEFLETVMVFLARGLMTAPET
jgi:AcrR family transcriptional regulator